MGRPKGGKNKEWSKEQKYEIIRLILNGEKSSYDLERELGVSSGMIRNWVRKFNKEGIDSLVLGCTHYPILQKQIEAAVGEGVTVLSSAEETAKDVESILRYNGQLRTSKEAPKHRFFASGSVPIFKSIATSWLQLDHIDVERITF